MSEHLRCQSTCDYEGGIGMMSEILGGVGVICKALIFNVFNSESCICVTAATNIPVTDVT